MSERRRLHQYAILTASAVFVLVVVGGLVTSTGSGLAVPDWPLSYGTWCPPMVGGILYEHGHRMIAGAVGLLVLALAVWLARAEQRRWVRRLGLAALGAVVLQALLGGLTVLLLLPPQISISHAVLGQSVFVLLVCLAWCTSPGWEAAPPRLTGERAAALRAAGTAVALLAAVQLLLGAIIRHTGYAVAAHLAGAALLAAAAVWCAVLARRVRREAPSLCRFAGRALWLVGAQLALGLAVFAHRGSVPLRTAHVALGALVLAQAVVLVWASLRRLPASDTATRARHLLPRCQAPGWPDYLELAKARLSALVLLTTATGFWLGVRSHSELIRLLPLTLGTALVAAGANALNQWMERDRDALMQRTSRRPLPAGRLAPAAAFRFGVGCSAAGLAVLLIWVNPLATAIAAASWASYVLVYTPLKRRTPLCTLIGAVPGALPPVIGWAGARHELTLEAAALFLLLFLWQLPHFLALAVLHRDDYARAAFPLLPLIEPEGLMTARQIALYGLALLPVSLVPSVIGVAGAVYFFGALALGLGFAGMAAKAAWARSAQSARRLFRTSILYLPALLVLLACDRGPR
jgi:protoheme IX farnesyltransferase